MERLTMGSVVPAQGTPPKNEFEARMQRFRDIAAAVVARRTSSEPEAAQPYLNFDPACERPGDPLEEAALKFHKENPHVIREIVQACLNMKRAGHDHWSVDAAFHVVRYEGAIKRNGRTYKLNNNHTPFYARWIMRDVPELAGFFTTRDQGRMAQSYDE